MNKYSIPRQHVSIVLTGLVANMILACIKIITGIMGNTYALIADGIESTLDIFSSLVVYHGMRIGNQPPDEEHPFGHGKAEALAALIVSTGLIVAASGIAVGSFREIVQPRNTPAPFTLIVLLAVILIKEVLFRRLDTAGKHSGSLPMKPDAWHHRSDAITSFAAFIGISLALIGGSRFMNADDWAALLASSLIAFNGFTMLKASVAEIMDAAPDPAIESAIRLMAMTINDVKGIEKCRVRKSGTWYFVEIHVEVDGNITVAHSHYIGHQVKDTLINSPLKIADVMIHIEPAKPDAT